VPNIGLRLALLARQLPATLQAYIATVDV
jgi:hypothetical protein